MKTLFIGKNPDPPREASWWVGMESTCPKCGSKFMIETGDRVYVEEDKSTGRVSQIKFMCVICEGIVEICRPLATTPLMKFRQGLK